MDAIEGVFTKEAALVDGGVMTKADVDAMRHRANTNTISGKPTRTMGT